MPRITLLAWSLGLALQALGCPVPEATRDGSHDFDFETGAWKTHVRRLQGPLSGSTTWVEYNGTSIVRAVLGGRANLVELAVEGPAGRIEGAALRLYEPQSKRWTLNFFNAADGQLTTAQSGAFIDGQGLFCGEDTLRGKPILVRFAISRITADSYRFEQAFSADRGKTWEVNWVATDTRGS